MQTKNNLLVFNYVHHHPLLGNETSYDIKLVGKQDLLLHAATVTPKMRTPVTECALDGGDRICPFFIISPCHWWPQPQPTGIQF